MTPALLALSRAYLALPGAPVRDMIADELAVNGAPDGYPRFRDRAGLLWCSDFGADRPAPWVLDLTDAATGGVMLDRLGVAAWRVSRRHPYGSALPWCAGLYFSDRPHVAGVNPTVNCATLAEAVARVAVALGRAG